MSTGSNKVGTPIQQATAQNAVKCVLELGGKSPQIVFDDVDVERAVPIIVRAIVQNAAQTCTAASRLLVQRAMLAAMPFEDEDDAIALTNGTEHGLLAAAMAVKKVYRP